MIIGYAGYMVYSDIDRDHSNCKIDKKLPLIFIDKMLEEVRIYATNGNGYNFETCA